jgi:class 3 adenylate cyclase
MEVSMNAFPKLLGAFLAPYGLMLRLPLGDRPRFEPRTQLRYVDVALALREATDPATRLKLLLEKTEIESTARRFDEALNCLEAASALAEPLGEALRVKVVYLRGKIFYRAARYDEAVAAFEKVVRASPDEDVDARRALLQLGRVRLNQGRFAEARSDLRRGLQGGGHSRQNTLGGLYDLVFALVGEAMLDEADAALVEAEQQIDPRDGADSARVAYYKGWLAFTRRRLPDAVAQMEHASREFSLHHDQDAHACAELGLARMELAMTDLGACADRCERARALPDLRPDEVICLSLLRGLALFVAGKFGEAAAEYRRAERHAASTGSTGLRCRALEWQAELDTFQGEPERALEALAVSRELRRDVGDALGEAIALSIMGNAHRVAERFAHAAACYADARTIADRIGNRIELGRVASEEMRLAIAAGDFKLAEERGHDALHLYEALGKRGRRSLVVHQLAALAALRDDFDGAERLYDEAIAHLGDAPDRIMLAEILESRADARADRGALDEALADLTRAEALASSAGSIYLVQTARTHAEELRQRHAAQSVLSRYLEPKIASRILARGPRRLAENIQQEATILFSDIRGYTTLTERLGAQEVVAFLNEHFTAMTEEIVAHGGSIDKFIGDAVMAVFGDPGKPAPDDALRSVRAAIAMVQRRDVLNEERVRRGLDPILIGVGIESGPIVMGNIGSPRRLTFTVVGDAVNSASRLEGLTKTMGCPILIGSSTYSRLDGSIATRSLGEVEVKGRAGKIAVYAVPA